MPSETEASALLTFFTQAGALKDTLRSARTATGRVESVAEHSWRLAVMALVLAPTEPGLDLTRVLQLCLIHDLGEALGGDVPAPAQTTDPDRKARERQDVRSVVAALPPAQRDALIAAYDEADAGTTPEARFVKALDKLETCLQHVEGAQVPDFDFAFNLSYGRAATDAVPTIAALRRPVDDRTRARSASARASEPSTA
ncbi:HD domain-containing protein [Roseospira marina]|uniref:5'-deoxynucleotidase n=1 Tax=Roseospira marina TaxID=140057 RepID=A0A5M6IFS5_9PROT|nr:HD domain-containing protein [Roseospira marina]KAA5607103.1 HD domain-containing protein [Roseospira marina]MBB4312703.1 putative hydrolase of HD superfamily [Roseospira marina]MBB5086524.1 putative hydrolase of HD superfamily [Roseospira marina]